MISEVLKPNVQELQGQVIDLLEQVSDLMSRASTQLWFEDGSESKYKTYQEQVDKEYRKVENLELRMAIAAPMNAGKSTIINAIIGQELLPSCATAMTTLPTEIVFKANATESILKLSPRIRSAFQEAFLALKQKIDVQGISKVLEDTAEYPHLADLLHKIHNMTDFPVSVEISGRDEVNKKLTDLNHIIRLCSILDLSEDPLKSLNDTDIPPRIETPFWRSQQNEQPQKLGNLVIIDTPGPNEAGVSNKLESVVSTQLWNSQLVLIVLDFTQLKAEAAEKIKYEVDKVIRTRGKKNLYVLVNKVDQRRKGDMDTEKVGKFVADNLKLLDDNDTDRVFEISARQAFCSSAFFREAQQHSDVKESETAKALAQELWSVDWEEELENATVEELQRKAERLWKRSGFAPFLEKAISAIMAEVAPRCMESALNLCLVRLQGLCEDTKLRQSGIAKKAEELQGGIEALNAELSNLQKCRGSLDGEVSKIKKRLRQTVNENIERLRRDVRKQLSQNLPDSADNSFKNTFSRYLKIIPNPGVFEFESEEDAKSFANKVAESTNLIVKNQLNKTCKDTEEETDELIKELSDLLESKTKPIIESARNRLKKDFDVSLDLDTIKIVDVYTRVNEPGTSYSRGFDFDFQVLLNKLFDNIFAFIWEYIILQNPIVKAIRDGIRSLAAFFGFKTEEKAKYIIKLMPYIEEVIKVIENNREKIKTQAEAYIESYFQHKIDRYFKALDSYLGNYRDDLEQSLKDKNLPLQKLDELKHILNSFADADGANRLEIGKLIKQANTLLEDTKQLLPQR